MGGTGSNKKTRKATSFKPLRLNYCEINKVTSTFQIGSLDKTCKKKGLKQKKWKSPSNFTYSKLSRYQVFA